MKEKEKENKPLSSNDLVDLALGKREPRTEDEKELQKDIQDIIKKGRIVEIPKDFL